VLAQLQRLTGVFGEVLCGRAVAEFAFSEVGVQFAFDAEVDAVFGVFEVDPFAEGVEAGFVGGGVFMEGGVEGVWGGGVRCVDLGVGGQVSCAPSESSLFCFGVGFAALVCGPGTCIGA